MQILSRAPAAVLWDMDGTLVDTEPYWMEAERELVEAYGGEWPEHHAKAVVGFDLLDSAEYIREHGGVPLEPEEIVERLLDGVIARLRGNIPWRPGARRLLRELNHAGVPCALVTMSWRRMVDPIVAALPPDSFDAVITGDEVPAGHGKPNPTPYLMAAELCAADPRDCVAIEDSPTGVRSARAAGCRVLGVPNVRSLDGLRGLTDRRLAARRHGRRPRRIAGGGAGADRTDHAAGSIAAPSCSAGSWSWRCCWRCSRCCVRKAARRSWCCRRARSRSTCGRRTGR